MKVFIAPGMKVPKGNVNEAVEWTMADELHPFWYVKRGQPEDKKNMELVFLSTSQILACDAKALIVKGASVKNVMEVALIQYLCLVNTVDVGANEELILEWSQLAVTAPRKSEKGQSAYDQLEADAKKSKRARLKGGTEA